MMPYRIPFFNVLMKIARPRGVGILPLMPRKGTAALDVGVAGRAGSNPARGTKIRKTQ